MDENIFASAPRVDFVMNVFERTYRVMLQPGEVRKRAEQHLFPFQKRVVLVNNVANRGNAEIMLSALLRDAEIDEAYFVEDYVAEALERAGLSLPSIKKTIHYTDCALVAIFITGGTYLLYSDADVMLASPCNWITPALDLMQRDTRIAVTNPNWTPSTIAFEAREQTENFALGYGFSDQLFLVRRDQFAQPIYDETALISWRFPLSHISPVFEQMVDSWMRRHRRLRATYLGASYHHVADEGAGYRTMSLRSKWKRRIMQLVLKFGQWLPGDDPRYHT